MTALKLIKPIILVQDLSRDSHTNACRISSADFALPFLNHSLRKGESSVVTCVTTRC